MTKKGPLGTAEKYYVKGHYKTVSIEDIAKALDRPLVTVKNLVSKLDREDPVSSTITAGSQMARREGIVLMTENASSMADDKKTANKKSSKRDCVTRIKND